MDVSVRYSDDRDHDGILRFEGDGARPIHGQKLEHKLFEGVWYGTWYGMEVW